MHALIKTVKNHLNISWQKHFLLRYFFKLCFHVNNKLKLKNDDSMKYLQSIKDYKIMRSILVMYNTLKLISKMKKDLV